MAVRRYSVRGPVPAGWVPMSLADGGEWVSYREFSAEVTRLNERITSLIQANNREVEDWRRFQRFLRDAEREIEQLKAGNANP